MAAIAQTVLITAALPYANGAIHLGHLVEYIQADIYVRFLRSMGHEVHFVCGEDAHGTAIMIKARSQGITPELLIAEIKQQHERSFKAFAVDFDMFHTTHSEENKTFATTIYQRLQQRGDITVRTIEQAFDPVEQIFLPDRFVKGTCPNCQAEDQYGDNCEVCGATYDPTDLIHAVSVLSGVAPTQKASEHYFFRLNKYQALLQQWLVAGHLQPEVSNKLQEWFAAGLQEWDISRDAPYFGFEIPGAKDKYFYVWLDAPIGYMASFQKLCEITKGLDFARYWGKDSDVDLIHFIGKDIIYFHGLFWPALLMGSGFRTPTAIYSHGFLTVNGQKMSKSRGTFITADTYLAYCEPECLRYYFAAKLGAGIDDIDLNLTDFITRVNADLVGKVVNIASRCASFIHKLFDNKLAATLHDTTLYTHFVQAGELIAKQYYSRDYKGAVRHIMNLADQANQYIDTQKPWDLAKQPDQATEVQLVCTQGINLFYVLMIYLQPIIPILAKNSAAFLQVETMQWQDRTTPLLGKQVALFQPLLARIQESAVIQMLANE